MVFVMEEEYRMQKAQGDISAVVNGTSASTSSAVAEKGEDGKEKEKDGGVDSGADENASTRGMVSPASVDAPTIPTIRISTESERMKKAEESTFEANGHAGDEEEGQSSSAEVEGQATPTVEETVVVGKPEQAAIPPPSKDEQQDGKHHQHRHQESMGGADFSFSNKRLCERWLDNLFMVLYEVRHPITILPLLTSVCLICRTSASGRYSAPK